MKTIQSKTIKVKLIGYLFIIAAISSIIGLKLYAPILANRDFITSAKHNTFQIILGAINELILVVTAAGTGIILYPYLKRYGESWGLGYLSFRLLEVIFIMIGIVSVLTALSMSQYYVNGIISKELTKSVMLSCISRHKWTFILGPNFMLAINTFLYSFVFYKKEMVPRNLSKLGLISSLLIMTASILELFGVIEQISSWGILLALPIALYEMILAGWLIAKGLSLDSESDETTNNEE